MKLLLDQKLSYRLLEKLTPSYPSSSRVRIKHPFVKSVLVTPIVFMLTACTPLPPRWTHPILGITQRPTDAVSVCSGNAATKHLQLDAARKHRVNEEITAVFSCNEGLIQRVYRDALLRDRNLAGQVMVQLTVSPEGIVTEAKMRESNMHDSTMEAELLETIKKFSFDAASVDSTTVKVPIVFTPGPMK